MMLVDFEQGEIYSKSEIELAVIEDVKQELKTNTPTSENVKKLITPQRMLLKYLYLMRQTLISNL